MIKDALQALRGESVDCEALGGVCMCACLSVCVLFQAFDQHLTMGYTSTACPSEAIASAQSAKLKALQLKISVATHQQNWSVTKLQFQVMLEAAPWLLPLPSRRKKSQGLCACEGTPSIAPHVSFPKQDPMAEHGGAYHACR